MGFHEHRLLYLLYLYTGRGNERDRWLKEPALLALIAKGSKSGAFPRYELHPTVVLWFNTWRVVKVSREAEVDLRKLREEGLVEKLRLSTPGYSFVTAFRISKRGYERLSSITDSDKREVLERLCRGAPPEVVFVGDERRPLLRYRDGQEEEVDIFTQEHVSYKLRPRCD